MASFDPLPDPRRPDLRERAEAAEQRVAELEAALHEIATRPKVERNPDGVDQAAWTMALIAEDALKGDGAR